MKNQTWTKDQNQLELFFGSIQDSLKMLARKASKMLPGNPKNVASELISSVHMQLMSRIQRFHENQASEPCRDHEVWSCKDPQHAAELIFDNYLLKDLVRVAVARLQKTALNLVQSDILKEVPARFDDQKLKEERDMVFKTANQVLNQKEQVLFRNEYNRRLQSTRSEARSDNERARWRRVKIKLQQHLKLPIILLVSLLGFQPIHSSGIDSRSFTEGTSGNQEVFASADMLLADQHQGLKVVAIHQGEKDSVSQRKNQLVSQVPAAKQLGSTRLVNHQGLKNRTLCDGLQLASLASHGQEHQG